MWRYECEGDLPNSPDECDFVAEGSYYEVVKAVREHREKEHLQAEF